MEKGKEIGPPTPIAPGNMMPIFIADGREVERRRVFLDADGERRRAIGCGSRAIRIFPRCCWTAKSKARTWWSPAWRQGAYYWTVQSYDAAGKESVESEKNRFTIIPRATEKVELSLDIDPFIQHGHVIEVPGKTEAGARVMVNGREVPMVADDGSFHYFTPPLPNGENMITVTAQNSKGGVNTQQEKVVIQ